MLANEGGRELESVNEGHDDAAGGSAVRLRGADVGVQVRSPGMGGVVGSPGPVRRQVLDEEQRGRGEALLGGVLPVGAAAHGEEAPVVRSDCGFDRDDGALSERRLDVVVERHAVPAHGEVVVALSILGGAAEPDRALAVQAVRARLGKRHCVRIGIVRIHPPAAALLRASVEVTRGGGSHDSVAERVREEGAQD